MPMKQFLLLVFTFISTSTFSQNGLIIRGKITDNITKDPIPFASVNFKNTAIGKNTDFEGNFEFKLNAIPSDSLLISCMGYFTKSVYVFKDSSSQFIEISLKPSEILLNEVKVYAGENPAFKIIRNAVKAKDANNFRKLAGFDYQSYNKIEVDVNKISEKLQKRNITQKINNSIAELGKLTDEEGNVLLPTFISESISHYYFRNNPRLSKEVIEKTNIKGVGVTDGSLTSQVIGSSFQQYNFYGNQVNILEKNFSSPISDDWKLIYDYYLADSTYFGDIFCYQIDFTPKRKQDLAFSGTLWVDKKTWGVAQIDATISKDANLNFVERIKIQQELEPIGEVWFPIKNRIVIDINELTKSSAGMLLKFTSYNENIRTDSIKDVKFFDNGIEIKPDYTENSQDFWQKARPEPFTSQEQLAYAMVDTIRNLPIVKRYSNLALLATSGYKEFVNGYEFGPIIYSGAYNSIEGLRLRLGVRTNVDFSKNWILKGYVAYGFKDEKWKGGGEITRIVSRKPWTTLQLKYTNDIEQVGLRNEDLGLGSLFSAYMKFGTLRNPFKEVENLFQFQREVSKGVFTNLGVRTRSFTPLYNFSFRETPSLGELSPLRSSFKTTELTAEITFARDELAVISDNERLSFGTTKSPVISIRYTHGLKNKFYGDFTFDNIRAKLSHTLNLGYLGKTYYKAEVGAIIGNVPYPLLKSHLGNESIFLVGTSFNLMNYFEFVSDRYASVRYTHDFEGLLFNRVPLIKKWKWRTFTTGKFLMGGLSASNNALFTNTENVNTRTLNSLSSIPYIELGYGINNILKVLRIEAMHRLTYLNTPDVRKFGIKFTLELTL